MAQQILDVSTPNSGLGDALRDASIKSNDNFTELYNDKVDKVIGKDLSDNNLTDALITKINDLEANAQVNVQSDWNENDIEADAYIKNKPEQLFSSLGYFDYADLATQTTPITVAPNTQTLLTNDADGADTNISQPPYGVTAIWDADSDEFNFSQLSIGDTVDIRVHLKTTTTTANQKYHVDMKFAFDAPDEFENRIFSQVVKTYGEDEQTFITTLYIGSESVKNYPARFYITSDDDATVKVVGWFCRVFRKSVNIVGVLVEDDAPSDGLTYGRKDAGWVEVSGGGSVGTLQQVTDNGNTTDKDIETGNVTATDIIGDTAPFTGNYSPSSSPSDKLMRFDDIDTGNILNIKTIKPNDATRDVYIQDGSGILAYVSDIPTVDATPTDGSSNAVSSNGVFDALALKQDFATDSFASTITFDVPKVYNSFSSPSSSNISQSLTGARIGVVQKFYSNKATEPTYPAGWVKLSGTYTNSVTNIIYAEWCEGSRVEYWIVKA